MPITLIYIDRTIYQDNALTEALQRKLKAKNRSVKSIHFLEENDLALIDTLQTLLDGPLEFCIAASANTYPLISRILATLKGDALIATGNTLHPASATEVKENSSLFQLKEAQCNLILLKNGEKIPELLLRPKKAYIIWQLLGNETQLLRLKQYANDNHFHFDYYQLIDGWYEIRTENAYHIDKLLSPSPDPDLFLFPSNNIFDTCIEVLGSEGKTISFAESCTGGLIASSFTARSGSSNILNGSVVSYANKIKHQWLGVSKEVLENPGAVSRACVIEMAEGARRMAQSDIALATSGIAGPTGGTPLKPVGTVYIAAANAKETRSKHLLLRGDRNYIQYQATMHVIKLMIELEKKNFEKFFKNP